MILRVFGTMSGLQVCGEHAKSQKEPDSGAFVIITALQAHVHTKKSICG